MKIPVSKSLPGFTLIELLIVISILAIISTVVVVAINPVEMLASARDSNRLSDLTNLNKTLQIAEVQGGISFGNSNTVYVSIPDSSLNCSNLGLPTLPSGWFYACRNSADYKKVDGNGWIPVNFSSIYSGSPLSILPVDPINATSSNLYYTYTAGGSWELNNFLESQKYIARSVNDGGDDGYLFEIGSNLILSPYIPRGTFLTQKDPATIKFLIIEYADCGQGLLSQLSRLGFSNVTTDTGVTTEAQVAAYKPDIVIGSEGCWGINKSSLFNQLYSDGYRIYTEGNDTSNSITPISAGVNISTQAGQIIPSATHPINQNWATTPNSGTDGRYGVTALNQNAFALGQDASLGYREIIYLEETRKGRWFHVQPLPAPDDNLFKNALFYMAR